MENAKLGFCLSTFTASEVVIDQFGLEKLQSIQERYMWRKTPSGLAPEVVGNLNIQHIPDNDIGIMYDLIPSYVGKKKIQWKQAGIWKGPTDIREIKKDEANAWNTWCESYVVWWVCKEHKRLVYKFVWRKYGAVLESIKSTTGLGVEDLI